MKITLKWIKEIFACPDGLSVFEKEFGEFSELVDVHNWICKLKKPEWGVWLMGQNDPNVTKGFLDLGVYVDIRDNWGWTPLYWAVWCRNEETIIFLIKNGADVDQNCYLDSTPRSLAKVIKISRVIEDLEK